MANFFYITLDTTAPQNPSLILGDNSGTALTPYIDVHIHTDDLDTTGYKVKLWGNVYESFDANIQTNEVDSSWFPFANTIPIQLSSGNETKTIYLRIVDDVLNETDEISQGITLSVITSYPIVMISNQDVSKISFISGRNACSFSFKSNSDFIEYKVKVVNSVFDLHTAGVAIGTTQGSTNVAGTGTFAANTNTICTIKGQDLFEASRGDGEKLIKVFVKDSNGAWSKSGILRLILDTTSPHITIKTLKHIEIGKGVHLRIMSNELLNNYQDIYVQDINGKTQSISLNYNGFEFTGDVVLNNLDIGSAQIIANVRDEVFNPTQSISDLTIVNENILFLTISESLMESKEYIKPRSGILYEKLMDSFIGEEVIQ